MMRWGRVTAAVSLLAVGTMLALDLAGLIDSWKWLYTAWPAVFILLGVELIVLQAVARSRNRKLCFSWGGMLGAALLIVLAMLLVHGERIKNGLAPDLHWIDYVSAGRKGEAADLEAVRAPVPAGVSAIVIRHKAGNVTVRQSGDTAELTVRGVAWTVWGGDAKGDTLRNVRLEIRDTGDRLEIAAVAPSESRWWWWRRMPVVDLEVTVPANAAQVKRVEAGTVGGTIEAGPLGSDARLKTVDGDIILAEIRGGVFAETVNGDVTVSDVEGNAELKTTNGDIRAVRISGQAAGNTVNGDILIEKAGGGARANTVNGDITIAGAVLAGDWEAKSMHGNIVLRLPDGADAAIRIKHRFGDLKSDFPLRMEQSSAEGILGSGTHRVTAETNGDIAVERYGTSSAAADGEPAGPEFH